MGEIGIVQESSAYLLSVYALGLSDIAVREAVCNAAQTYALQRPGSQYTASALVAIAAQVHVSHLASNAVGHF